MGAFEQEALALLRSKVAFMANYDGSRQVRPMKPFVDEANRPGCSVKFGNKKSAN